MSSRIQDFQNHQRRDVSGKKIPTLLLSLLPCGMASAPALALDMGVNIHERTEQAVSDIMQARNLKNARMDLTADSNMAAMRAQVSRIKANGGKVEVSLQTSYQWDHSCNQNLASVEQKTYDEATAIVNNYKEVIHDYELLNEVSLRPETVAEVPFNSAGTSTAPYAGKPCYKTITAVLRGMSRAIHDIKLSSGYPLRVILGAVGRDFGFLTYMQQQGVVFDVVGFHIYPHADQASLLNDPWYGAGGPLAQLAEFNLPVHINEFDCGEIYNASYDNQAGSAETYKCFQSYKKHIPELFNQTLVNLESLHVYELFDDSSKSGAEGRFGLMYDSNTPKVHLSIITAYAGGTLSTAEQQAVTGLNILTDTEIAAYKTSTEPVVLTTLSAPINITVSIQN